MQALDDRYSVLESPSSFSEEIFVCSTIEDEKKFIEVEKISAEIKHRKFLHISENLSSTRGIRFPRIFSRSSEPKKAKTLEIRSISIERNVSLRQPILMKQLFKNLAIDSLNNKNIKLAFKYINLAFKIFKKFDQSSSYVEDELLMNIEIEYSKKYPSSKINQSIKTDVKRLLEKYRTVKMNLAKLDFMVKIVSYSLELDSKDVTLWNELGFLHMKQEKSLLALEAFNKALSLDSHNMVALRSCASICFMQRNTDGTMKYIRAALARSSTDKAILKLYSKLLKVIDAEEVLQAR